MVEQVNVGFLNGHSYIDNTDKGSTRPVLNIEDAMEVDRVKEKELEQNQKTITLSAQTMSTDVDQVGDITAEKVIDTFPDQAVDFPGRRTSGRKRTTPNFYKSEPLPVKKDYKRLKKKADQQRAKKIASGKVVKEPSKNISKGKNVKVKKDNKDKEKKDKKGSKSQKDRKGDVKKGKKDPFIISLKLARKREAAPSFVKLETGSKELLWIKLSLRDFLIRCRCCLDCCCLC